MAKQIAFLVRPTRIILTLVALMCLLAPAEAQHGGGGGHSAGGHFGSGHSSGRHSGGSGSGASHSGWLHLGFGNRAGRRAGRLGTVDTPRHLVPELVKGATPVRAAPWASIQPAPQRSLWFPVLFPPRFVGNSFSFSSRFRRRPSFLFGRFPCFRASGCFFDGFTQVCFFEPALPLFFFSAGFDSFLSGFGFRGDSFGIDDDLTSPGTMQPGIAMNSSTAGSSADTSTLGGENLPTNGGAKVDAAADAVDEEVGEGFFLLVLKNGTSHAATDYWLADGYLEYVSLDRTRSHVPLEALDLQKTVIENSRRGLPFVLRSAPADTRVCFFCNEGIRH
jgi:hypothetical protein